MGGFLFYKNPAPSFRGEKHIFFCCAEGNNEARTRLYRIAISNNLAEVLEDVEVLGLTDRGWLNFKKGKEYKAFLIHNK